MEGGSCYTSNWKGIKKQNNPFAINFVYLAKPRLKNLVASALGMSQMTERVEVDDDVLKVSCTHGDENCPSAIFRVSSVLLKSIKLTVLAADVL